MPANYCPMTAVKAVKTLLEKSENLGLSVTVERDFLDLEEACRQFDGKELSEQFSPGYFDLTPATGFWLAARKGDGTLVSVQAARIEDLGGTTLAEHWRHQQKRIYVGDTPAALGDEHCPGAHDITGRVVYHGDMWLEAEFRGTGAASHLCRIGQLTAYMKWQPDFIYCFMSQKLVDSGFSTAQGYFHMQPAGTHWIDPPHHIRPDDWLLWNTAADLHHLARTIYE